MSQAGPAAAIMILAWQAQGLRPHTRRGKRQSLSAGRLRDVGRAAQNLQLMQRREA